MTEHTSERRESVIAPLSTMPSSPVQSKPQDQTWQRGSSGSQSVESNNGTWRELWIIEPNKAILSREWSKTTDKEENDKSGDLPAAWIIGPYLVIHISLLSFIALRTWLAPDWAVFTQLIPLPPFNYEILRQIVGAQKFYALQSVILACCAAGIGGAIFMVRSFYLNFAYGRENAKQKVNYLKNKEIPRYILLPFSSFVLGPVALGLLRTGSIVFSGTSIEKKIPLLSVVTVSFLLGFAYHDTLTFLRKLSRQILDSEKKEKPTEKSS